MWSAEAPLPGVRNQPGAPGIMKAKTYKAIRFGAACHPKAGLEAVFVEERMLLILRCRECNTEMMRAEIAKEFSRANDANFKTDGLVQLSS